MGAALDAAFQSSERTPDLVLSGHVHDYQRFTRTMADGRKVPYVVIGNGGYDNLHKLAWTGALIITFAVLTMSILARLFESQKES